MVELPVGAFLCPIPSPCSEPDPVLGHAVARRYAREGYAVTLVGRRQEPLDLLAEELTSAGATAHVITADLSRTEATPRLAEQIRAKAGHLDAFYYAPTPATGFVSAASLTPQHAQNFMPLIFYTMLALVQEPVPWAFSPAPSVTLCRLLHPECSHCRRGPNTDRMPGRGGSVRRRPYLSSAAVSDRDGQNNVT